LLNIHKMFATNAYSKRVAIVFAVVQLLFSLAACATLVSGIVFGERTWPFRFGTSVAAVTVLDASLHVWLRRNERTNRVFGLLSMGTVGLAFAGTVELVCSEGTGSATGFLDAGACLMIVAFSAITARLGAAAIEANEEVDVSFELKNCNSPWTTSELL
jgi:predicted membrane protein